MSTRNMTQVNPITGRLRTNNITLNRIDINAFTEDLIDEKEKDTKELWLQEKSLPLKRHWHKTKLNLA